jgi:MFS family permease
MMMTHPAKTSRHNATTVAISAAIICFLTYASVYAFRKPFTVASFSGMKFLGLDYKVCLVISQVFGYMLSKFYGIRFIAELNRSRRARISITLMSIAWLALLGFALVPAPYNIIFLFINGFPLGMMWGIVFSYAEGRRATDFIGAALAVSFIFSSGFAKSVAKYLQLQWNVTEFWLPFVTAGLFVLPLIGFMILLERVPPPDEADVKARTERLPMTKTERRNFFKAFAPGLVLLVFLYILLTIFRDIRDNFAADMWKELGFGNQPAVFTQTELPITLITLIVIASMILVRNNLRALMYSHALVAIGFLIAGASTWLFVNQQLAPLWWMTAVGLGLYMAYIPFNCVLFERLIAAFKHPGNVGFLIYIADSFGYLGSTGVLFTKEIFKIQTNWTDFYTKNVLVLSAIGFIGTIIAAAYFYRKHRAVSKAA